MNTYRPSPWLYIVCYAVWLVLVAATIWLLFLVRVNILDFVYVFGARPAVATLIDRLVLIPLALAAIAVIIVLETHLRGGVNSNRFWPRVAKASLFVFGAIALSYALHFAVVTIRLA